MLNEIAWLFVGVIAVLSILILAWPLSQGWLAAMAGTPGRRTGIGILGMLATGVLAATLTYRGPEPTAPPGNIAAVDDKVAGADLISSATRMNAATTAPAVKPAATSMKVPSMEISTAKLAARLEKQGGTKADWKLLGQSYDFLGKKDEAAKAYAKADAQPK